MDVTKRNNRQAGVTLIEMIVVVAIFAMVASVLFFNFSDFNSGISIRTLSQDVALATRKAQTYATSTRTLDGAGALSDTYPAYGVSFSVDDPSSTYGPSNKEFILFADNTTLSGDINRYYDNGGTCGAPNSSSECVESFRITSADKIVELCTDYPVANTCMTSGTVNVVFRRPSPDAEICIVSGGQCVTQLGSYVKVVLQSIKGARKTVTVWNTGQISGQ